MRGFDKYLGIPSRVLDGPTEAVCFDAVGTLFQVRSSVGQIYGEWAAKYGFHSGTKLPVQNKIQKAFLEVFRDHGPMVFLEKQNKSIQELERQWWRNLVRKTFAQVGEFPRIEEFFEAIYEFFSTSGAWELEPGATETLFRLQKAGKQLAVISNFDSRLCKLLEELDIRQYFDVVIVSSLAQVSKPNPLIFRSALGAMGCHPERVVHVGDDLKEDFEGACSAGLRGVLYDPKDRFREQIQGLRIKKLLDVLLIFPVGVC